jgi:osmotically-inducible protein OsmY
MKINSKQLSAITLISLVGLSACNNPETAQEAENKVDQVVESAEMKAEQGAKKIEAASDSAGVKIEDAAITTKIKTAYLAESAIKSMDIQVNTTDGVVTLTGTSDSVANSQKASDIAGAVAEVKHVNNQLVVQ